MHFWTTDFFFFFFSYPQPTVRPAAAYTAVNKKLPTFSCLFDSLLSSGVTAVIYLSPVVSRQANTAAQRQAILSRRLLPHFVAFVRLRPVVSSPWLDNIILPWHPGKKKSFWLIKKPLSAPRARLVIGFLWVIRRKWKLHCGPAPSTHITICQWMEQAQKIFTQQCTNVRSVFFFLHCM